MKLIDSGCAKQDLLSGLAVDWKCDDTGAIAFVKESLPELCAYLSTGPAFEADQEDTDSDEDEEMKSTASCSDDEDVDMDDESCEKKKKKGKKARIEHSLPWTMLIRGEKKSLVTYGKNPTGAELRFVKGTDKAGIKDSIIYICSSSYYSLAAHAFLSCFLITRSTATRVPIDEKLFKAFRKTLKKGKKRAVEDSEEACIDLTVDKDALAVPSTRMKIKVEKVEAEVRPSKKREYYTAVAIHVLHLIMNNL